MISLSGCTTNPYTGRWQFVPFPSGYMAGLEARSYAQVINSPNIKISKDPQEVEPVQQVAERIIEAAKQSKYAEKARAFKWASDSCLRLKGSNIPTCVPSPSAAMPAWEAIGLSP
ncbi:hypothetical protein [Nitrospira sp. Nam74]